MKRLLLGCCLSVTMFFSSCDSLKEIASVLVPSQADMVTGLKDALTQGLFSGFDAFANPSEGNALLRFALPGDAAKIEKTLKDLGMSSLLNDVTGKFTTAMSSAVLAAKPIFLNSVKQMSLTDAAGILITDNTHAATEYFKSAMSPQLMTAFRPIVDSTANLNGANKAWSNLATVYNKIPLVSNKLETSLTDFIAARAIDAMFVSVANEEENIRTKYEFRKTAMMKKVFGYAEQELKRRKDNG